MSLVTLNEISFQAGTKPLFEALSLSVQPCDRIGLVGHNGCGKSTLLSLILGNTEADLGQRHIQRGLKIGQVEQFLPESLESTTAFDAVLTCLPEDERIVSGYRVESLLAMLGFDESLMRQPLSGMSGGQKNLTLLARAIIQDPELLLLDEPGNHMDSRAMTFLKRYLKSTDAPAFVMISHDRDLLDETTSHTLWLRDLRCYSFKLPYSEAKDALAAQDEAARKARETEEKQIDKLKVSAKRLATWGKVYDNEDLARKAKSMEKRIDKLEANKTFVTQGTGLSLSVDAEFLKAKQLFTAENQNIETPDGRGLFSIELATFRPGDRIALLGANGTGKSTMIEKLMTVWQQDVGQQTSLRFNPNVQIGYFDQELTAFETDLGILDWVREHSSANDETIKRTLIHWGFPYVDQDRRVNVLSGGERARLLLLTFQLEQPNLLVMDEPTNHIDLQGKEELEADLQQSGLSLLFTSHDQRFIQTVATRYWWINNGQLTEIHDPAPYFLQLEQQDLSGNAVTLSGNETSSSSAVNDDLSEEKILERIVELETLLEEDKARKAKFQKPKRQQQWQEELDKLYQQMG